MKTTIAALAVAILLFVVADADAQLVFPSGPPTGMGVVAAPASLGVYVPPYSYYASYYYNPGRPARGYVGLGNDIFPFYGHPYGSPNDPWTWTYMSSNRYPTLARYYYPPVR
jgi:hypothetical protein